MKAATNIEYSPGMPNFLIRTVDRSFGGGVNSATLGATILLAVGDEMGIPLAMSYTF